MRTSFLWRNRVALTSGILLLLSGHLLSIGVKPSDPSARPGLLLLELLRPFQAIVEQSGNAVGGLWSNYLDLVRVRQENQQLKQELAQLKTRQSQMAELELENQHLGELLELHDALGGRSIAANIIGSDATGLSRTLILSVGSNSGLKPDMAVISNQGVVGKTIAVGSNVSRVLLIDDHNSALDALDEKTRARGIVAGVVDDGLAMKYVDRAEVVNLGDPVVTSGLDGIFPRGLLVGQVTKVKREGPGLFVNVNVRPAVDFHNLEQVLVIIEQPPAPPPSVKG